MIKILIVEDDPSISHGLQVTLELEGYEVSHAASLKEAEEKNAGQELDLILLDLGLPDGNGFSFLKKLREKSKRIPVIVVTAQTDENSVVEGLQLGANDYIRKPFGQKELIARIKSTLKEPQLKDHQLRFGDLLILVDQRVVKFKQENIELNSREFEILRYLAERPERVVTREALLQAFDRDGDIFDRSVDSYVSRLRNKLKKTGVLGIKITSVYGLGYRIEVTNEN